MSRNAQEFISKMMQAKQLEKEAVQSLLPENARKHLDVIEKECRKILIECLQEKNEKQEAGEQKRTRKVTIE